MDSLENLLNDTLDQLLKPDELFFRLIVSKLIGKGINLSNKQKSQIRDQISKNVSDNINLELSWWQKRKLKKDNIEKIFLNLEIDANLLEEKITQSVCEATQEVVTTLLQSLVDSWKSQSSSILEKQQKGNSTHRKMVEQIWSAPLTLLEMLLSISFDLGSTFNEYYRPTAAEENDYIFEALTRLHSRGCQIGAEALLLLRHGFGDGAHARWRTLHEICVEAIYISQREIEVAEKYLLHSTISDYRISSEYKKHYARIGYAPPDKKEIKDIYNARSELISQFGKLYKYDYGWATSKEDNKAPTFADLEKSVGLEHMRPFYKLANINVHSGSKGAIFRLGSPPSDKELLVAGPSIYGLGEPGQNIAYSFFLLTSTLLLSRENLDQLVVVSALDQIKNETIWAFDNIMEEQEI